VEQPAAPNDQGQNSNENQAAAMGAHNRQALNEDAEQTRHVQRVAEDIHEDADTEHPQADESDANIGVDISRRPPGARTPG
jgi:hypothetical protein